MPPKGNGDSNRSDAPYLFRPVQTDSPDGSPSRMRTRNKNAATANEVGTELLNFFFYIYETHDLNLL